MTTTDTVEIPADVLGNSRDVLRIQWRNTKRITVQGLRDTIRDACEMFGHAVYVWEDTDRDGNRVTLTRIVGRESGHTFELLATYYFTRVPCAYCESSWAQRFYRYANDPEGTEPVPLCGTHGDATQHSARRNIDTLHMSEPLNIGQH